MCKHAHRLETNKSALRIQGLIKDLNDITSEELVTMYTQGFKSWTEGDNWEGVRKELDLVPWQWSWTVSRRRGWAGLAVVAVGRRRLLPSQRLQRFASWSREGMQRQKWGITRKRRPIDGWNTAAGRREQMRRRKIDSKTNRSLYFLNGMSNRSLLGAVLRSGFGD
jgi:hypothetical protein